MQRPIAYGNLSRKDQCPVEKVEISAHRTKYNVSPNVILRRCLRVLHALMSGLGLPSRRFDR